MMEASHNRHARHVYHYNITVSSTFHLAGEMMVITMFFPLKLFDQNVAKEVAPLNNVQYAAVAICTW
jgi:hypothetical protein